MYEQVKQNIKVDNKLGIIIKTVEKALEEDGTKKYF